MQSFILAKFKLYVNVVLIIKKLHKSTNTLMVQLSVHFYLAHQFYLGVFTLYSRFFNDFTGSFRGVRIRKTKLITAAMPTPSKELTDNPDLLKEASIGIL